MILKLFRKILVYPVPKLYHSLSRWLFIFMPYIWAEPKTHDLIIVLILFNSTCDFAPEVVNGIEFKLISRYWDVVTGIK